jgi:hypothetical protein
MGLNLTCLGVRQSFRSEITLMKSEGLICASLVILSIWLLTVPTPVPLQISDAEFRRIVLDFSEAGGSFPWENVLSNELPFQNVIPNIKQSVQPGGAYLGVGPEQNFTYLAAFEPGIAFIIDIRRQNMLEQLLRERCRASAEYLQHVYSFCYQQPV